MLYQLEFDIRSYWRAGTGRGGGSLLNETIQRDAHQLPVIPGRTVKGLLRDAVWRMEQWGHFGEKKGLEDKWFGTRLDQNGLPEEKDDKDTEIHKPKSGVIRVSSAELESGLREYLISIEGTKDFNDLKGRFYKKLYATAIGEDGTAEDQSLRAMEVTIPLMLYATIDIDEADFKDLSKCLPLIRSIGSNRTRGLGRVAISLKPVGVQNDAV